MDQVTSKICGGQPSKNLSYISMYYACLRKCFFWHSIRMVFPSYQLKKSQGGEQCTILNAGFNKSWHMFSWPLEIITRGKGMILTYKRNQAYFVWLHTLKTCGEMIKLLSFLQVTVNEVINTCIRFIPRS